MPEFHLDGSPTLVDFLECNAYEQQVIGPFGSGKSSACINKLTTLATEQTPFPDGVVRARAAVVRNTYPELKDTTISSWMDWYDPQQGWGRYDANDHVYRMNWQDDDGRRYEYEVRFRALDRADQVKKLLSAEYTHAWVNENREMPMQIWDALGGRINRYPSRKDVHTGAVHPCVIGDTNPPDTDHWIYTKFEEHLAPDGRELSADEVAQLALFRQPSGLSDRAENLINLPADYYVRLASGKGDDFKRVYVDGEYGYVQEGKPVYSEYNDQVHCREFDVDPRWPVQRGFDFGLSPACVMTALKPNGQWLVFDEVVASRMGAAALAEEVNLHCGKDWPRMKWGETDIGDPAGRTPSESEERSCFRAMKEKGIVLRPGHQTLERRLGSVRGRLTTMIDGEPSVLIHPRCRVLRKGFQGGYQYRRLKVSGERYVDTPDKNAWSHPHDALQYIGTVLFTYTGGEKSSTPPRVRRSI